MTNCRGFYSRLHVESLTGNMTGNASRDGTWPNPVNITVELGKTRHLNRFVSIKLVCTQT